MYVFALGEPEGNLRRRLLCRGIHRDANPALDLTDVFEIRVEPRAIARAQWPLEGRNLLSHRIENAGAPFPSEPPFLRARPISKQPFKRYTRVDLSWQGLHG